MKANNKKLKTENKVYSRGNSEDFRHAHYFLFPSEQYLYKNTCSTAQRPPAAGLPDSEHILNCITQISSNLNGKL
jgi:hypothetical protein